MKLLKLGLALVLSATAILPISAKISYAPSDISIPAYQINTNGSQLNVQILLNASALPLHSNQEAVIVPTVKNGSNQAPMEPIYICGRNRMIYHERNNQNYKYMFRNGKDASEIVYNSSVPFAKWMDGADVSLDIIWQGCANCAADYEVWKPMASISMVPPVYEEQLIFLPAQAEPVKVRNEKGTAYIDFVVGKTNILPDFRNNKKELAKIEMSINNVKNDTDVTINQISIQGSASPEGPYENNVRLAKGRNEALMSFVKNLYSFPESVKFKTSYIAEDWEGLKEKVDGLDIVNKEKILVLITDKNITDDQKDYQIKKDFPTQYAYLLKNVYPSLRHSDYEITYTVRRYYDVEEILSIMEKAPQKLSLSEFYLASQSLEPGSDRYNEVFETAVRMFPDDPVANFNAASIAISKKDYKAAEKYLEKAPQDNKTRYLRGVMAAKQGNYQEARDFFSQIKGMSEAISALQTVNAILAGPSGNLNVIDRRENN